MSDIKASFPLAKTLSTLFEPIARFYAKQPQSMMALSGMTIDAGFIVQALLNHHVTLPMLALTCLTFVGNTILLAYDQMGGGSEEKGLAADIVGGFRFLAKLITSPANFLPKDMKQLINDKAFGLAFLFHVGNGAALTWSAFANFGDTNPFNALTRLALGLTVLTACSLFATAGLLPERYKDPKTTMLEIGSKLFLISALAQIADAAFTTVAAVHAPMLWPLAIAKIVTSIGGVSAQISQRSHIDHHKAKPVLEP